MEVDLKRNRIALSMKTNPDLDGERRSSSADRGPSQGGNRNPRPAGGGNQRPAAPSNNDWFSQAMNQAKKK